jgi:hypothetical protein
MTSAEYLAWEREQPERHHYWHGEVFSMAGGSPRQAALIAAVTIELGVGHREGPCRTLSTEMRIVAEEGEHYVYADASVVCGPMQLASGTKDVLANPSVVVEVLSKTTEDFQREASGEWHYRVVGAGGRVNLKTGAVVEVDSVFRGVFELEGGRRCHRSTSRRSRRERGTPCRIWPRAATGGRAPP